MKTKIRWIVLLNAFAAITCLAQTVAFTTQNNGTNVIIIPEGEIWQCVTATVCGTSGGNQNLEVYSSTNFVSNNLVSYLPLFSYFRDLGPGPYLPGPLYIKTSAYASQTGVPNYLLVFKKNKSSESIATSLSSIVVPTTAVGDIDLKLEQSSDQVTWTECLPGTYNSSTVKRFFRLRAVEK